MRQLRGVFVFFISYSLCGFTISLQAAGKPLGVLALAYGARLNTSEAFAGLSIFPGEVMDTETDGKAMVRVGASAATLSGDSSMTLEPIGEGAHVDLLAGAVFVTSMEKNLLEVHVADAMLRPHGQQITEARILIYAPKVLQITTRLGSLDFSYHGDFRVLPEGQTFRIYLDSDAAPEAQGPAGAGSGNTGTPQNSGSMSTGTKVAFYILAGVGTGLAAWGIVDVIQSNNSIESPAKP